MEQLNSYELLDNPYLSEQRKHPRQEVVNLLAITVRGTGQVLDIGNEGLSFGCLYPHAFPDQFYLDILDAQGSHIKKLKVNKIWTTQVDYQKIPSAYELVVGVEFCDLSPSQQKQLNYLFECMKSRDNCSPPLVMV